MVPTTRAPAPGVSGINVSRTLTARKWSPCGALLLWLAVSLVIWGGVVGSLVAST